MKQLREIISNKLILILALISSGTFAKEIAKVSSVKGNVFLIKQDGSSSALKKGDMIFDFSEIFCEDDSQVSFTDYHEHKVHLSGGSQISVMNKMIELKNGNIWIQSAVNTPGFTVQTSNAISSYSDSEFIVNYDVTKLSTQLMVISGSVKFSNLLEEDLSYDVAAGNFTFIDQNFEKGFPRVPTLIGYESYNNLVSIFEGVKPTNKSLPSVLAKQDLKNDLKKVKNISSRKIASVAKNQDSSSKIIFIRAKKVIRLPASADVSGYKYFEHVNKKSSKKYKPFKGDTIEVRVFGEPFQKSTVNVIPSPVSDPIVAPEVKVLAIEAKDRIPSSIPKVEVPDPAPAKVSLKQDNFEQDLVKQYADQKRHSNEVNDLIDELKTFSKDFKKNY